MASYKHFPVVVVGAGISGLKCGQDLRRKHGLKFSDVLIVEAQEYLGGRIKQNHTFIPGMEVDVGAEFIHGCDTVLNELADTKGWEQERLFVWAQGDGGPYHETVDGGFAWYYLGKEKKLLSWDDKSDPDFQKLNNIIPILQETEPETTWGDTRSFRQFLEDEGIPERMMGLAEAGIGNTAGASLDRVSYAASCMLEWGWENDGEIDSRLKPSFRVLVDYLKQGLNIRTRFPIKKIDYSLPGKVSLTSASGEVITADHVVVTVPLAVLQDNVISFVPSLPPFKTRALADLGMEDVCKVLLKFSALFYPENLHGIICADCFVPEFWFRKVSSSSKKKDKEYCFVSGYCMGDNARRVLSVSKEIAIQKALDQLDEIFGQAFGETKVASKAFIGGEVHGWGENPFIRGGYSFPKTVRADTIEDLQKSLDNKVFFAGEATHTGAYATLHAAYETGDNISQRISEIRQRKSDDIWCCKKAYSSHSHLTEPKNTVRSKL